ncbi:MAG: hypothetical protein H0V05_13455 [Euzebyaceae bacterium]|nr:hypothetical protein [Euzebyaceae bacterium]
MFEPRHAEEDVEGRAEVILDDRAVAHGKAVEHGGVEQPSGLVADAGVGVAAVAGDAHGDACYGHD